LECPFSFVLLKLLGTGCADDKKDWSLPRFAAWVNFIDDVRLK
jgi:hypothetical protein